MLRRTFLAFGFASCLSPLRSAFASNVDWGRDSGIKLAQAAHAQLGVTTGYDPNYSRIPYPNGDVLRTTGVCADVVIRAARDALQLDLQQLLHDDMKANFAAYPRAWGMKSPDANIDHRRVLNLEVFWQRAGARIWTAAAQSSADAFPGPLEAGDLLTWLLNGRLPHVGIVVSNGLLGARIVHNIGSGVQENALWQMSGQRAKGHYRWPVA